MAPRVADLRVLGLLTAFASLGAGRRHETVGVGGSPGDPAVVVSAPQPTEKRAPVEPESDVRQPTDLDEEFAEDVAEKWVYNVTTSEDLRRAETDWRYIWHHERPEVKAFFYQQLPRAIPQFFATWPVLDPSTGETPERFVRRFLNQNSGYSWTLDLTGDIFCELAYEGFLSTSMQVPVSGFSPLQIMLPWNERTRHILDWQEVHVSRGLRRRAKNYHITVDTAFDQVILECVRMHGEDWLYRGLRAVLRDIFEVGYLGGRDIAVSVHTFELWEGDRLVAGDLGYAVGGVYTSMTGFRLQNTMGAGKMQMVLTAALLQKMGYLWWDLGMVMKYKEELGARVVSRDIFIQRLRAGRDQRIEFGHASIGGRELLDHFTRVRNHTVMADLQRQQDRRENEYGQALFSKVGTHSRSPLRTPLREEFFPAAALLEQPLPTLQRPPLQALEEPLIPTRAPGGPVSSASSAAPGRVGRGCGGAADAGVDCFR